MSAPAVAELSAIPAIPATSSRATAAPRAYATGHDPRGRQVSPTRSDRSGAAGTGGAGGITTSHPRASYLVRSTGPATAVATVGPAGTVGASASVGVGTGAGSAPFSVALSGALDEYTGSAAGVASGAAPAALAATTATVGIPTATGPADGGTVTGDSVVADARRYLGVPYVWGGETTRGLDCSGLVQLTFHDLGISLPRVAADQAKQGTEIPSLAQARPGDLLAFGDPAYHIAIYLGNDKLLESPEPGKSVHITDVYRTPTTIRRIVPAGTDAAATNTAETRAGVAGTATDTSQSAAWSSTASSISAVPRAVPLSTIALAGSTGSGAADAVPRATGAELPAVSAATSIPPDAGTAGGITTSGGRTAAQLTAAGLSGAVAAYAGQFADAEARFSLPPGLLAAVAQQESSGDAGAVSPVGAQGLMQLMPSTARALGVDDPFDPRQAIPGAARLLADDLRQFGGSVPLALAAYNAGPAAVTKYGGIPPYRETQDYVRSVTGMLARLA